MWPPALVGDDGPSLVDLAAMARAASAAPAPASDARDEEDRIVELVSWTAQSPSASPRAWSAPPRADRHGLRIVAIASVLLVGMGIASVVVTVMGIATAVLVAGSRPVAASPAATRVDPSAATTAADRPKVPTQLRTVPVSGSTIAAAVRSTPTERATVAADSARPARSVADRSTVRLAWRPRARAIELRSSAVALAQPATTVVGAPARSAVPVDSAALLPAMLVEGEVALAAAQSLATPDPGLPDVPTRAAVLAAIEGVRPQLESCAATRHGAAEVLITVRSSGRVGSPIVSGDFAGTPEGSCLARAVRGALFPVFARATFVVSYPLVLWPAIDERGSR